ncbi:elongation factor G [Desulfurella sp.]|uniref:elongation factor G n=1 Tax=Desulfurella sp. TaxID=1962857 RepID=UPI003D0D028A
MSEVDKKVIAICGAGGCGKSTLVEDILFVNKKITRKGSTEKGNLTMDFDSEEMERKVSIQLSIANIQINNSIIYLIDTPGYHNFIGDALCGIKASDCAILVVDIQEGVKAQTERFYYELEREKKPFVVFVNAIDKENSDFKKAFKSINELFKAIAFELPITKDNKTVGYIDILSLKAYNFNQEEINLPDELKDEADNYHSQMIEEVSSLKDELLENYLSGDALNQELFSNTLFEAIQSQKIIPVLVGSAFLGYNTQKLIDFANTYLPSAKNEDNTSKGLVFKTYNDPQSGKLSLIRVLSGKFPPDSVYYNLNKEQEERIGAVQTLIGKTTTNMTSAEAGDIIAVAKLKYTQTGDTLSNDKKDTPVEFVKMPLPFISYAVYGSSKNDDEKISTYMGKILESDPTLSFKKNIETNEFILTGMGANHLEVVVSRLKKFGLDIKLKLPKVAYKETIKEKTTHKARFKKQTGGHGQFGDVTIEIEPLPRGAGFEFVDMIVGGAIPRQFIPSVEKGVKSAMEKGPLAEYPITDIKVKLIDGMYHPVDSSDFSFQMAGSMAFKEGVQKCKPTLLEPILEMEVFVPEENVGDIIGDINARRGKMLKMETYGKRHNFKQVVVLIPEAEILEYAPTLRSLTSGRGFFRTKFYGYEEVPAQKAQKIIESAKSQEN